MTEYVHIGAHADMLASGRVIAPGERVAPADLDLEREDRASEDQHILDEGRLVEATSFDGDTNAQTRKELRARAAELGIEGWSSMKVDELRTAVAEREASEGVASAA